MAKKTEAAAPGPAPAKKADKAAPAAKPQAASSGETVYFLQLAAFKDPQDTAKLCRQVKSLGFQCYFGTVNTAGGRYWRLRLGPYDAQGKAEADLAKLKGKGFDGRLIPLKKSVVRAPIQLPGK
jgi:cell division septation protein DedD